jgi:hypothetical protein
MDPFLALRQQAAIKRDEAMAHARRVYRDDIEAIEALEKRIPPTTAQRAQATFKRGMNTVDLMKSLVPPDQPFQLADMLRWLYEVRKGEKFREASVRTYLSRLAARGSIRKLYKTGSNGALWISTGATATTGGIETMSIPEVVELILEAEGRPLRVLELVVGMHARGYRQKSSPKTLARSIRDMFKRYPGRFVEGEHGKWAMVRD